MKLESEVKRFDPRTDGLLIPGSEEGMRLRVKDEEVAKKLAKRFEGSPLENIVSALADVGIEVPEGKTLVWVGLDEIRNRLQLESLSSSRVYPGYNERQILARFSTNTGAVLEDAIAVDGGDDLGPVSSLNWGFVTFAVDYFREDEADTAFTECNIFSTDEKLNLEDITPEDLQYIGSIRVVKTELVGRVKRVGSHRADRD